MEIIEKTKEFVKKTLKDMDSSHDYYHIIRTYNLARVIGEKEGADCLIVSLASLLHDIADHKYYDGDMEIGGTIAHDFLLKQGVELSIIDTVKGIIDSLSFSKGTIPDTLEGKVVQDADRLDAIGAIGIARTLSYGGYRKRVLYNPNSTGEYTIKHFYDKLLLLKDLMNTNTARIIAQSRHQFMELFLDQFFKEWNCPDYDL